MTAALGALSQEHYVEMASLAALGISACLTTTSVDAAPPLPRAPAKINGLLAGMFVLISAILALPIILMGRYVSKHRALLQWPGKTVQRARLWNANRLAGNKTMAAGATAADPEQSPAARDPAAAAVSETLLQQMAHFDPVTGLADRVLFRDRLNQAISLANRIKHGLTLLALDFDGLRAVDHCYGRATRDKLLQEIANRLSVCVRDNDTVARLGDDEFVVLQVLAGEMSFASALAQRVVELLSEPYTIDGLRIVIRVRLGIALCPSDGASGETLLRKAHLALARVKAAGNSSFSFFATELDEQLHEREALERDLRDAIRRGQLELYYQPLRDIETLAITGYEALVRWHHPLRGDIAPELFVPLADDCGLTVQLGRWVMETACHEAANWDQPHRITVNLSRRQVLQLDLVPMITQALKWSGLAPDRLELEVTEPALLDDPEQALKVLRGLKTLGVDIALDGFGTGYSSLGYLCRFPFDRIKIDKTFVQSLPVSDDAGAFVDAIVALGTSLGIGVTAAGVETEDQLLSLRRRQCGQVQGFLLDHPAPSSRLSPQSGPLSSPERAADASLLQL